MAGAWARQQVPLSVTIKCNLIILDIDELLANYVPFSLYEALSCTWGDAPDRVSNKLDGHNFEVTSNSIAAASARRRNTDLSGLMPSASIRQTYSSWMSKSPQWDSSIAKQSR